MQFLTNAEIAHLLPYDALIDALREAFRGHSTIPPRGFHDIPTVGAPIHFGLMPGWAEHGTFGAKLVTVTPDNATRDVPAVQAVVILFDRVTGTPRAVLEATELTRRRTAAASALAVRHLAREDARVLTLVGTGPQAQHQARALCAVRSLRTIRVWGRDATKAEILANTLRQETSASDVTATRDLKSAIATSDIVSSATASATPLILGDWVRPGTHIDLVGAFTPGTREADSELVARAALFADVTENVLAEAGDYLIPIAEGRITRNAIRADLAGLSRGAQGRASKEEITVFKSVGTALEDIAAAELALTRSAP